MAASTERPHRVRKTTQNTADFFYSFPLTGGARKRQRKNIDALLRKEPEKLHYDFRCEDLDDSGVLSLDDEPADIQFWTDRSDVWQTVLGKHYAPQSPTWSDLPYMKQMKIDKSIIINFYHNGKVMIQGATKMVLMKDFPKHQNCVNELDFADKQTAAASASAKKSRTKKPVAADTTDFNTMNTVTVTVSDSHDIVTVSDTDSSSSSTSSHCQAPPPSPPSPPVSVLPGTPSPSPSLVRRLINSVFGSTSISEVQELDTPVRQLFLTSLNDSTDLSESDMTTTSVEDLVLLEAEKSTVDDSAATESPRNTGYGPTEGIPVVPEALHVQAEPTTPPLEPALQDDSAGVLLPPPPEFSDASSPVDVQPPAHLSRDLHHLRL